MKTALFITAFAILINLLPYLPLIMKRRRLKKEVGLQKARAEIAVCAEAMQIYLAKRHTVSGQPVHDFHYEAINEAQYYDKYFTLMTLFNRQKRAKISRVRETIRDEIKNLPPNVAKISHRFNVAYLRAAYYRQPKRFWLIVSISIVKVLCDKLAAHIRQRRPVQASAPLKKNKPAKIIDFQKARPTFDLRIPAYGLAASWFIAIGAASFACPTTPLHTGPALQQPA